MNLNSKKNHIIQPAISLNFSGWIPANHLRGWRQEKSLISAKPALTRLRAVAPLRANTNAMQGMQIQVLLESLGPLLGLTIPASLRKTGTSHSMHVGNFGTFHRTDSILRAPCSSPPNDVLKETFWLTSFCTSCPSRTSSLFSIGYEYLPLSLVCWFSHLLGNRYIWHGVWTSVNIKCSFFLADMSYFIRRLNEYDVSTAFAISTKSSS